MVVVFPLSLVLAVGSKRSIIQFLQSLLGSSKDTTPVFMMEVKW